MAAEQRNGGVHLLEIDLRQGIVDEFHVVPETVAPLHSTVEDDLYVLRLAVREEIRRGTAGNLLSGLRGRYALSSSRRPPPP